MRTDGTWTILVVEDQSGTRTSLIECLDKDYSVLHAKSSSDAKRVLAQEEVDLVLCHQHLPDATAVDLLRETRISHPEAIRILITATIKHEELIHLINDAAVYQVVPEPWQPDHLLLLV